jgi:hypothetical protein
MVSPAHQEINCSICNKPVNLETAKIDDNGNAVHEECYVLNVVMKLRSQRSVETRFV